MTTEVLERTTGQHLTRRAATVEEFWALPESVLPAEYINGEILMAPAPTPLHQAISGNVFTALNDHVRKSALGHLFYAPADVVLPSGDVVQPDIFLLSDRDYKRDVTAKRIHGTPPFLVEILSPGSVKHDTLTKHDLYERNGVREYWIVDPKARAIAQHELRKKRYAQTERAGGDSIKSAALAGFEMGVGELLGVA